MCVNKNDFINLKKPTVWGRPNARIACTRVTKNVKRHDARDSMIDISKMPLRRVRWDKLVNHELGFTFDVTIAPSLWVPKLD